MLGSAAPWDRPSNGISSRGQCITAESCTAYSMCAPHAHILAQMQSTSPAQPDEMCGCSTQHPAIEATPWREEGCVSIGDIQAAQYACKDAYPVAHECYGLGEGNFRFIFESPPCLAGFVEEMRIVAMKLHTREQAPKEGEKEAKEQAEQSVKQVGTCCLSPCKLKW